MTDSLRLYTGPLNNRIDRVESVGNQFRISGVPNHIQKTNVIVQEQIKLQRNRKVGLTDKTSDEKAGDFEDLANRATYKFPSYPYDLPRAPRANELCVDPLTLSKDTSVKFRRWALNRSFDRVTWRSDNSVNEYDSQVFDTIELQPWLSHSDCTTDISRSNKSIANELYWHDFTRDEDSSTALQPDMVAPVSYRSRVLFGTWPANGDADYVIGAAMDEASGTVNLHGVPLSVMAPSTFQLKFDTVNWKYTAFSGDDAYFQIKEANNGDIFSQLEGTAQEKVLLSAVFWDDKFYRAVNKAKTELK